MLVDTMVLREPTSPFEKALAGLTDEELDDQEHVYETDISTLNVLLGAVRATKEARQALRGSSQDQTPVRRPRTLVDAVIAVMRTDPGRVWTADEILADLRRRGWAPQGQTPKNTIDATLSRARQAGAVVRLERGEYRLPSAVDVIDNTLRLEVLDRGTRLGDER
jgi:hypothetical protein